MFLLFSPNHTKILTVSSSFAYIDNIFLLKCMSSKKEIEEFSFKYCIAMMEGRESKVDKIVEEEMNSNIRTYIQLRKINDALKSFKQSCSNSKSEERQRQYRALEYRYILDDKKTVEEIAEMEHVSTTTVTRDINIAIARFTFFLRPDLEFFD